MNKSNVFIIFLSFLICVKSFSNSSHRSFLNDDDIFVTSIDEIFAGNLEDGLFGAANVGGMYNPFGLFTTNEFYIKIALFTSAKSPLGKPKYYDNIFLAESGLINLDKFETLTNAELNPLINRDIRIRGVVLNSIINGLPDSVTDIYLKFYFYEYYPMSIRSRLIDDALISLPLFDQQIESVNLTDTDTTGSIEYTSRGLLNDSEESFHYGTFDSGAYASLSFNVERGTGWNFSTQYSKISIYGKEFWKELKVMAIQSLADPIVEYCTKKNPVEYDGFAAIAARERDYDKCEKKQLTLKSSFEKNKIKLNRYLRNHLQSE